jgi:hypothetical protein
MLVLYPNNQGQKHKSSAKHLSYFHFSSSSLVSFHQWGIAIDVPVRIWRQTKKMKAANCPMIKKIGGTDVEWLFLTAEASRRD